MFSLVRASFWTAAFASFFMGAALIIPNWFGRYNDDGSFELHGAFYRYECGIEGQCSIIGCLLESQAVPLEGQTWVEIAVIPALTLACYLPCFIAVTVLQIIGCRCCGTWREMWTIILAVTILLKLSALIASVTVCLAIYACSEFYSVTSLDRWEEFPWSVMCLAVGAVLNILSVVFFVIILCNWVKHKHMYPNLDEDVKDGSSVRSDNDGYMNSTASVCSTNKDYKIKNESFARIGKAKPIDTIYNSGSFFNLEKDTFPILPRSNSVATIGKGSTVAEFDRQSVLTCSSNVKKLPGYSSIYFGSKLSVSSTHG